MNAENAKRRLLAAVVLTLIAFIVAKDAARKAWERRRRARRDEP